MNLWMTELILFLVSTETETTQTTETNSTENGFKRHTGNRSGIHPNIAVIVVGDSWIQLRHVIWRKRICFTFVSSTQRIKPCMYLKISSLGFSYNKLKWIPKRVRSFALGSFTTQLYHLFIWSILLKVYLNSKFILTSQIGAPWLDIWCIKSVSGRSNLKHYSVEIERLHRVLFF